MGKRERWVDEIEAETKGSVVIAVLRSIRDAPGSLLSGNATVGLELH